MFARNGDCVCVDWSTVGGASGGGSFWEKTSQCVAFAGCAGAGIAYSGAS